jgi:hypothetical protein
LHESGSLQGNETVAVGKAPAQPHGRVTTWVVVHCGTRHDLHAVAVLVRVGQGAALLQGFVTVEVKLVVVTRVVVLVLTLTLTTVDVTVSWLM